MSNIKTIRNIRSLLLGQVKGLSIEHFNQIPRGFNNNIAWNLGHLIAVQQGICYKKAGLPILISDDFWEKFRSGSKPDGIFSEGDMADIRQLLVFTVDQLETDYNNHAFDNYNAWSTRIGTRVAGIDDGLEFLLFHEKLHAGTIATQKKLVI